MAFAALPIEESFESQAPKITDERFIAENVGELSEDDFDGGNSSSDSDEDSAKDFESGAHLTQTREVDDSEERYIPSEARRMTRKNSEDKFLGKEIDRLSKHIVSKNPPSSASSSSTSYVPASSFFQLNATNLNLNDAEAEKFFF